MEINTLVNIFIYIMGRDLFGGGTQREYLFPTLGFRLGSGDRADGRERQGTGWGDESGWAGKRAKKKGQETEGRVPSLREFSF